MQGKIVHHEKFHSLLPIVYAGNGTTWLRILIGDTHLLERNHESFREPMMVGGQNVHNGNHLGCRASAHHHGVSWSITILWTSAFFYWSLKLVINPSCDLWSVYASAHHWISWSTTILWTSAFSNPLRKFCSSLWQNVSFEIESIIATETCSLV